MSLAISTFCSSKSPNLTFNLSSHTRHIFCSPIRSHVVPLCSFPIPLKQPFVSVQPQYHLLRYPEKKLGFRVNAENGGSESDVGVNTAEVEARGESTMPERFRYLTKEAPDTPVRWPWFVAAAFLLYAWRTVLWELSNWKKALAGIAKFLAYLSKLALALIFHFVGDPITSLIRAIETAIYTIRASYSAVVAYTPISQLTLIIILVSTVLAIAESVVPTSVETQSHLLTVSGIIGFAAVKGFISELFFWTLVVGLFGFSRLIQKKDYVSSALPAVAVLAAVGEPWVRFVVMTSYLALAVNHHAKKPLKDEDEAEVAAAAAGKVPFPLLCAALAIGVRVAAKWAGYRHLTWMIA